MKKLATLVVLTTCAAALNAQPVQQGNGWGSGYSNGNGYTGGNGYVGGNGYTGGNGYNYSSSTTQYGASTTTLNGTTDDILKTQVQNALATYQAKYQNVTVTLSGGNITLQGTVGSQDDKNALGSLVGGIPGVRSVNNLVTVQGDTTTQSYNSSSYQYSQSQGGTVAPQNNPQMYSNGSQSNYNNQAPQTVPNSTYYNQGTPATGTSGSYNGNNNQGNNW